MKWKFWEKDNLLKDKIEELDKKIREMQGNIAELSTYNKQMNRLQYKYNQDIIKSLEELENRIKKQEIDEELIAGLKKEIDSYTSSVKHNSGVLIDFIDEIDLIIKGLGDKEDKWSILLEKWVSRLLKLLERQGVYQLELLDKEFNPHMAEAISTVNKNGIGDYSKSSSTYNNHDIVEIIKRGYKDNNGELIRKALVIVYREGDGNNE